MIEKIKAKFRRNKTTPVVPEYTTEGVKKLVNDAYKIGYNDGKRDGLSVAREQAAKSLKEILWQQNKTK